MGRKSFGVAVAAILLAMNMGSMVAHAQFAGNVPVKNVIIMVPDGMSMGR